MRKIILYLVWLLLNITTTYAQPANDPILIPVFIEDFASTSLDPALWMSHYPWGTFTNTNISNYCDGVNYDLPCLQMDLTANHNIITDGNTCKLIGLKENVTGTVWTYPDDCNSAECAGYNCYGSYCFKPVQLPFKYSNGMLETKHKFKYGYMEMKFRVTGLSQNNAYNTFGPTFWLYAGDNNVPWSEIDIFEIQGDKQRFTNNIHLKYPPLTQQTIEGYDLGDNSIDLSQRHTAAVNWTAEFIDFYLDDKFIRRSTSIDNQKLIAMPIIIENGFPMLNFCVPLDNNTPFPVTYEIDYVKVLQPKQDCGLDQMYCNATPATFESKLYKSISIGSSNGCASVFNNGLAHAAGADFVLLDEGLEIGNNMEMTFDTPQCYAGIVQQRAASELQTPIPQDFQNSYINSRGLFTPIPH